MMKRRIAIPVQRFQRMRRMRKNKLRSRRKPHE